MRYKSAVLLVPRLVIVPKLSGQNRILDRWLKSNKIDNIYVFIMGGPEKGRVGMILVESIGGVGQVWQSNHNCQVRFMESSYFLRRCDLRSFGGTFNRSRTTEQGFI